MSKNNNKEKVRYFLPYEETINLFQKFMPATYATDYFINEIRKLAFKEPESKYPSSECEQYIDTDRVLKFHKMIFNTVYGATGKRIVFCECGNCLYCIHGMCTKDVIKIDDDRCLSYEERN